MQTRNAVARQEIITPLQELEVKFHILLPEGRRNLEMLPRKGERESTCRRKRARKPGWVQSAVSEQTQT